MKNEIRSGVLALLSFSMVAVFLAATSAVLAAENPNARAVIEQPGIVAEWNFDKGPERWLAMHHCSLAAAGGTLSITSRGDDPYLMCPTGIDAGGLAVTIRAKANAAGPGAIYWATEKAAISEDQRANWPLVHDGQWREYTVRFTAAARLTMLRLDPSMARGVVEIDWIRITRWSLHPIAVDEISTHDGKLAVRVRNDSTAKRVVTVAGDAVELEPGAERIVEITPPGDAPMSAFVLDITSPGVPPIRRTLFVHRADRETEWLKLEALNRTRDKLFVARDGSVARIFRGQELVAVLGPIVHIGGEIPKFTASSTRDNAIHLTGDGIAVRLEFKRGDLEVSMESDKVCEGPCLRAVGSLSQGVFAGLEYIEYGDTSSSKLDVETDEHLRFAPPQRHVTMPLMAVATNKANIAITWRDMTLQPVFASPNVYDGDADHRMALRGTKIEAAIRIEPSSHVWNDRRGGIEESILWAVKRHGLPPLPKEPRDRKAQRELDLAALTGPLRTADGWGHCIEPHFGRAPYGDMASTLWRLSGEAPKLDRVVPGGAHVRNDSIYFVTGRAEEWLRHAKAEIRHHIAEQQADGSYHYDGKYRRGHFENTASGLCATRAARLLELAHLTGDADALAAGRKTLEYMKGFRVPRGAQTWEVPLHTPDLLASAYLVWAYTRGYELTGDKEYLAEARRWALSGLPFVYLWSDRPVMAYSTIAVLGATNWQAPYWIGLPVQWVGGVYAYSLGLLAPHDDTLDWKHVARGILIAARQMQYPDGHNKGTLPDSFALDEQERRPWNINPCALVSLERLLDGDVDSLAVAREGKRHVVAPFAVKIVDGNAILDAPAGVKYQVVIDGEKVIDITSRGNDAIQLP